MNQEVLKGHKETLDQSFPVNDKRPDPEALWDSARRASEQQKREHPDDYLIGLSNFDDPLLKMIFIASARETVWKVEQRGTIFVGVFGLFRGVKSEVDHRFGLPISYRGCVIEEAFLAENEGQEDVLTWYVEHGMSIPGSLKSKQRELVPADLRWASLSEKSGPVQLAWSETSTQGDIHFGAFSPSRGWTYRLSGEGLVSTFTRGFRPPEAWAFDPVSKTVWFKGWIDGPLGYPDSRIIQVDPVSGTILSVFPFESTRPEPDPLIQFDVSTPASEAKP